MGVEIRQLTIGDAQAYRDIRLEMLQDAPEAFGDSYEEAVKRDLNFFEKRIEDSPIFGAFEDNILIGTAGYFIQSGLKVCHKAFLWGVYVTPCQRGKSLSLKLTKAVLSRLPEDVELIQTCVVKGNIPAERTYLKAEFKQWAVEEKALKIDGKYFDEVHMVKFLK